MIFGLMPSAIGTIDGNPLNRINPAFTTNLISWKGIRSCTKANEWDQVNVSKLTRWGWVLSLWWLVWNIKAYVKIKILASSLLFPVKANAAICDEQLSSNHESTIGTQQVAKETYMQQFESNLTVRKAIRRAPISKNVIQRPTSLLFKYEIDSVCYKITCLLGKCRPCTRSCVWRLVCQRHNREPQETVEFVSRIRRISYARRQQCSSETIFASSDSRFS